MKPVLKDAKNLGFQGAKYATLQSTIDAVEDALLNNDIVLTQTFKIGREGARILVTTLTHAPTRESIVSEIEIFAPYFNDPRKKIGEEDGRETRDPQAIGSAITYYRRYALQAICGVAPEDDDGNAASRQPAMAAAAKNDGPNVQNLKDLIRKRGAKTAAEANKMLTEVGFNGTFASMTEAEATTLIQTLSK